ncbi:MAG: hypothetical protein ABWX70_03570 [Hyphomicrobium sp.]
MTAMIDTILNSTNAALIIFAASTAIASAFVRSPLKRVAVGAIVVLVAMGIPVSVRSLFGWTVSAVERPSLPGFFLLVALAVSAAMGWQIARFAEFRFATLVLAVTGFVLYPGAAGFLNYDTYVIGYSGYLLPAAIAVVIAYALWRGYLLTALALNTAVAAFLLGAGESRNLWDYVIDPIAWIIGLGASIAIATGMVIGKFRTGEITASSQPSAGIGETPISH